MKNKLIYAALQHQAALNVYHGDDDHVLEASWLARQRISRLRMTLYQESYSPARCRPPQFMRKGHRYVAFHTPMPPAQRIEKRGRDVRISALEGGISITGDITSGSIL